MILRQLIRLSAASCLHPEATAFTARSPFVKAAKEAASAAAATEAVVAAAESAPQSYQVGAYDLMGV